LSAGSVSRRTTGSSQKAVKKAAAGAAQASRRQLGFQALFDFICCFRLEKRGTPSA
jgi:hypothetical protein